MPSPDPATTNWVPIWNPQSAGPVGPMGPQGPTGPPGNNVGLHAPSHYVAGLDAVDIKQLAGYSGIAGQFLNGVGAFVGGVALLAADQTFTGINTFTPNPDILANYPRMQGALPSFHFVETDQAVNAKVTTLAVQNGQFVIQARNDDFSGGSNLILITRAGVVTCNGAGIFQLNASNLASGLAAPLRLGNGAPSAATFLRGDSTWQPVESIPAGLIAMFDTICPAGWTRVASMDNRFPIGGTGFGALGGSDTHQHAFDQQSDPAGAHSHGFSGSGSGSGSASGSIGGTTNFENQDEDFTFDGGNQHRVIPRTGHDHPFSANVNIPVSVNVNVAGNTDGVGDHSHRVRGNTDVRSNMPPYISVVFCRKD